MGYFASSAEPPRVHRPFALLLRSNLRTELYELPVCQAFLSGVIARLVKLDRASIAVRVIEPVEQDLDARNHLLVLIGQLTHYVLEFGDSFINHVAVVADVAATSGCQIRLAGNPAALAGLLIGRHRTVADIEDGDDDEGEYDSDDGSHGGLLSKGGTGGYTELYTIITPRTNS